jgi:hypothetical protein
MSNDDFEIFGEAGVQYGNDVVPVNLGDTESFLRDVIELISSAPNAPLSSAPKINREQVLGLLEEALDCLPPEIAEARWMLAERDQFLAKTQIEADEILEAGRVKVARMVQRTEVVKAAEARARSVKEAANEDSRRLKSETEDFLDRRLGSFEVLLNRLVKTVAEGRVQMTAAANRPPNQVSLENETIQLFDQDDDL